ncbi:MAG TPA: DEAD/DEAH box helicase [Planctomycetota bacterium]|nr:DEAD/DEAH box helicase [Planctomycetota bacterium]
MTIGQHLQHIVSNIHYRDQVARVERLEPREARYAEIPGGLAREMAEALAKKGITQFYTHQAEAIGHVRAGRNVVIVTSTASGKTLCYTIPMVEHYLANPSSRALLIYPTKALAQDQLRGLNELKGLNPALRYEAGTYDGDTPGARRRTLRDSGSFILTNPDMLHQGILPNHAKWATFFSRLRLVVVDELHTYRGIFGSNVANVLRRLRRICEHYGSKPVFVCCSATIANPKEHAERMLGLPAELVNNDGSPRGPKDFALWNPPFIDDAKIERRGSVSEAKQLMVELVKNRVQTIAFLRTRLSAEIMFRYAQEELQRFGSKLAKSVHAYRGGYLPEERREIEQRLASGDLLGVASTNALELGIDIGGLDACLIVGYPGTIASLWQQAGRAGRGMNESVAILVAQNNPIDQYLVSNPDYIFGQPHENAVIDPDNPHISIGHIRAALYELPLTDAEMGTFGEYTPALLDILRDQRLARKTRSGWSYQHVPPNTGKRLTDFPAGDVQLRNMGNVIYEIQDATAKGRVIGYVDEMTAFMQVHPHAIYLHEAETYFVRELDLEKKIAFVEKRDIDYYTQAVAEEKIKIEETDNQQAWRRAQIFSGDVTLTTLVIMFKKIKFHSRDSIGYEGLTLPERKMETVGMWLVPPDSARAACEQHSRQIVDALVGLSNVVVAVLPLHVMCDSMDVGSVVDASCLGTEALFVYDRFEGGIGFAEKAYKLVEPIMQCALKLVQNCGCRTGCPSCVGSSTPAFAARPIDSGTRGRIADKEATLILLHDLLELEPYVPKYPPPAPDVPAAPGQRPQAKTEMKPLPPGLERKIRKRLQ